MTARTDSTVKIIDVLCIGHAAYDLTFQVPHHPAEDEKIVADGFIACGGGPAANAALTVARAGSQAAFAGYLGEDLFGDRHLSELHNAGVCTDWVARGSAPTPISTILAKPDGRRSLANYRGGVHYLAETALDFSYCQPRVILCDGHEPYVTLAQLAWARKHNVPSVLDAGSLHFGTEQLLGKVDHLVASEKFARQFSGESDPAAALESLAQHAPYAVITLGARGLLWARRDGQRGHLPAYAVDAVDTTGAGDVFHGAYAACLAAGRDWENTLNYASAAAALSCTGLGARAAIPDRAATEYLIEYGQRRGV